MADLDISEVASRSGLPASALRFYEEKGLIASVGRRGLHRLFDPGVMERAPISLGRTRSARRIRACRCRWAAADRPAVADPQGQGAG